MGKIYCRAKIFKRKIETKCNLLRLEVGQVDHNSAIKKKYATGSGFSIELL